MGSHSHSNSDWDPDRFASESGSEQLHPDQESEPDNDLQAPPLGSLALSLVVPDSDSSSESEPESAQLPENQNPEIPEQEFQFPEWVMQAEIDLVRRWAPH